MSSASNTPRIPRELQATDAILRVSLDRWRDAMHEAVDMCDLCSRLSMEASERGDREMAIRYSEEAVQWAKRLVR